MALIQNTGKTSTGATVSIPVAGLVASSRVALAATGLNNVLLHIRVEGT